MGRNLLLMSYCFPPANIIGAVRPYQIARYYHRHGWSVSVVSVIDGSIDDSDMSDISGISSSRLRVPQFISWLNTVKEYTGALGKLKTLFLRALKFLLRSSIFPEHFILLRKTYINEALLLARHKKFDLLISSALPFTVHSAARRVARELDIPWVADNRDLWASSPYRKTLPIWRIFDRYYERSILAEANLVLGVSQGMVTYYRDEYRFNRVLLVMNGYSAASSLLPMSTNRNDGRVEIVYGGILYNGVRDPAPLMQAINSDSFLKSCVTVRFFGAESDQVNRLAENFRDCSIESYARVSKAEISKIYQKASLLLVIIGDSDFENGVMTGKFFEYLSQGKPVIALASEESELARVINDFGLGLATRTPERIATFLRKYCYGATPTQIKLPLELSIDYQLSNLMQASEKLLALPKRE